MIIRKATENDIASWSALRTALWPETDDAHLAELRAFFAGHSNDIVETYVAVIDSTVIGFLELNIRNFAEGSRESQVPYVEGWYIHPDYQGKGYGRQLMQQAEDWALEKGYFELASDTEVDNKRSIKLHQQLGFIEKERVVCFLKTLKKT